MSIPPFQLMNKEFSDELGLHILSFLNKSELGQCSRVNSTWNRLIKDDSLWLNFFPKLTIPNNMNMKTFLNIHAVNSTSAIIKCIENFISIIKINQKSKLSFLFPNNPNCLIKVEFGYGRELLEETDLKDFFVFTSELSEKNKITIYKKGDESRFKLISCFVKLPQSISDSMIFCNQVMTILENRCTLLEGKKNFIAFFKSLFNFDYEPGF